jgi:nitroimidazol reductase NimA-like FMN-containing flavoprotein (pyridoxamine 5'-phosphate oxidase superfamily)
MIGDRMTAMGPVAEQKLTADEGLPTPWAEARQRLETAEKYWVTTGHPDGRPHLRPVLAVWVDGALHFSSSPGSRKSRNLAVDPAIAVSAACDDLDIVVEGTSAKITDETALERVAAAYKAKYGWPVEVRDGGFHAPYAAPTAGDAPYEVYRVRANAVLGFQTSAKFTSTRWRF